MSTNIGVGVLGGGFIGQLHCIALRAASISMKKPNLRAVPQIICDKNAAVANEIATRFEFAEASTDWSDIVQSDQVQLFVNAGPNDLHQEPTIAAARAGKHILCEKPLAGSADEAFRTWSEVAKTGVRHMCAFNYRSFPALNLLRQMIAAGEFGEVRHFRSRFLLSMLEPNGALNWRFSRPHAGYGAIGDLGSHHIDIARFLIGEVTRVGTIMKSWSVDKSGRITDVNDDAFVCAAELETGATASFEASRIANAHNLGGFVEVDGSKMSATFHMERLNEVVIYEPGRGPRTLMVTAADHPYSDFWLPTGVQGQHPIGWADVFAHQARHALDAAAGLGEIAPRATLEDGYRVAEIVDTMALSAQTGRFETVNFRELS
jgi:predicted dehydrogenase